MNEEIQVLLDRIPNIIECPVKMSKPNEPIILHQGDFKLTYDSNILNINGNIVFQWIPSIQVRFTGVIKDSLINSLNVFQIDVNKKYILVVNDKEYGKVLVSNGVLKFDNTTEVRVKGVLIDRLRIEHISTIAEKVVFAIANLRDFYGKTVKYSENNLIKTDNCRLSLENKDYVIYIDTCITEKTKNELKDEGGYLISHSGEIKKLSGDISLSIATEILDCLSLFLTFINGRATSVLFRKGVIANDIIFEDNSAYRTDSYKTVISWPQRFSVENLSQAWCNFSEQCKSEQYKNAYEYAIHWYVEANALSASTEGSIILAQTALELMYNFIVVENKKIVIGKDSQALSASNKIRLLLSQLSVGSQIPQTFKTLIEFAEANIEMVDGPEVITQIRNAIVHSQENKRKKLRTISGNCRYEALQLSIWYIELSLLYLVNYNGKYFNRTSGASWAGDGEELVPWAK